MGIWTNAILLILAVVVGGLIVTILESFSSIKQSKLIKLLLSFSGGFLLAIAFHHFLPELYHHDAQNVGLYVILGFIVQMLLEFFSGGIEHGHVHAHKGKHLPLMMLLSLSIHSFIEGIPLAIDTVSEMAHAGHDHDHGHGHHHHFSTDSYLLGIILHQIPVAIALMTLLRVSDFKKSTSWLVLMIFALMTPFGMFFGHAFGSNFDAAVMQNILAIVIGMFLHISTTIIFESTENHKFNLLKLASILLGIGLAVSINFH